MLEAYSTSVTIYFILGMFVGGFEQNNVRLMGLPLTYLTSLFIFISLIFWRIKLPKALQLIYYFAPFIIYSIIISILSYNIVSAIQYSIMWAINILLLVFYLTAANKNTIKYCNLFAFIVTSILFIAVTKFILNIQYDTNPFPIINRNASAFVVAILFMIELNLYLRKKIHKTLHYIFVIIFSMVVLGFQSRTLPFAVALHAFLVYRIQFLKFVNSNPVKFLFISLISIFFISLTPTAERIIERSTISLDPAESIQEHNYDMHRVILISNAIEVIGKNYLFGGGPGLDNYLKHAENTEYAYIRNARPHNFYLSMLADFGIFGVLLFIFGFLRFIKSTKKMGYKGHYQFLIPISLMLLFNEYILMPEIWVGYAIFINSYSASSRINRNLD